MKTRRWTATSSLLMSDTLAFRRQVAPHLASKNTIAVSPSSLTFSDLWKTAMLTLFGPARILRWS
jgi:hypothetical protein